MNVVMLGALLGAPGFPLSYGAVEKGIENSSKKEYLASNLISLTRGFEHALGLWNGGAGA